MRGIFYSLLLINLLYWVVHLFKSDEPLSSVESSIPSSSESPSIWLLSEWQQMQAQQKQAQQKQAEEKQAQATQTSTKKSVYACVEVGSFESKAAAQNWLNERVTPLKRVSKIKFSSRQAQKVEKYWLILPAFDRYDVAANQVANLKNKGVESYIINQGRFANAISLGVFSERQKAEVLQGKVEQLGYHAKIYPIVKNRQTFQLILQTETPQEKVILQLRPFLTAGIKVKAVKSACE